ncbi:HTH lacI-type domain-containing protein [Planctomycetales bacterium 10988]|nr:HTH lacI-type domain-containing protein [Planctomycetales bacterium 10988]
MMGLTIQAKHWEAFTMTVPCLRHPEGSLGLMTAKSSEEKNTMSVTLKQVADASKVSVSTASRALSGHPGINTKTATRVRETAQKLQYKFRSPESNSSPFEGMEVGILCLGMANSLTALPTVAAAIGGAESMLAAEGARTIYASVPDLQNPPESLLSKLPDALILNSALQGNVIQSGLKYFMQNLQSRPTVWLLGKPVRGWGDVVGTNDYEVGAIAARTLLKAGHRRLAFINPKPDHQLFQRREDGFRAAAKRGGAEVVLSLCDSSSTEWDFPLEVPENVELIDSSIDALLKRRNRPTGLFAAADSVAVLVYRALTTRGLVVGKDFSLVSGNNDSTLIAGLHPTLTTCDVEAFAIGQHAVRQLGLRLRVGNTMPETETWLPPNLKVGESVTSIQ